MLLSGTTLSSKTVTIPGNTFKIRLTTDGSVTYYGFNITNITDGSGTNNGGGNLKTKSEYAYTRGTVGTAVKTVNYTYDTAWKDKLTNYNGQSITYDAIGNPTNYRGNELEWEKGRQLKSYGSNKYAYNSDGQRIQKNVNGQIVEYTIIGGRIVHESRPSSSANNSISATLNSSYSTMSTSSGTVKLTSGLMTSKTGDTLTFLYDATDLLVGFIDNGMTYYYYGRNAQGDIVEIYNENSARVCQYVYDSWGKLISITGNNTAIGTKNPFRYRGYYYDTETGLYYLNSRYYDPEVGRFINADVLLDSGHELLGHNLYAYCSNNPVNMSDPSGFAPKWINDITGFFSSKTNSKKGSFQKGAFIGSGSLTAGYSELMLRGQADQKTFPTSGEPSVTVGVFAKISGGNATGKVGIGNNNVSLSAKAVGDVATASAQAGVCYRGGLGLTARAKASVFSGRATVEFQAFGSQIEFGLTGDAVSVGAEATIGIFDGGFHAKANASLGVGGGFVLRVRPFK